MDELLSMLTASGINCYIGDKYCGTLGYEDDICLLLNICQNFGETYDTLANQLLMS